MYAVCVYGLSWILFCCFLLWLRLLLILLFLLLTVYARARTFPFAKNKNCMHTNNMYAAVANINPSYVYNMNMCVKQKPICTKSIRSPPIRLRRCTQEMKLNRQNWQRAWRNKMKTMPNYLFIFSGFRFDCEYSFCAHTMSGKCDQVSVSVRRN